MRIVMFLMFVVTVSFANASFLSSPKKAVDQEGNCVPELITENARLYSEIEALDAIATRCEAQLKSPVKESWKLGFDGLRDLSAKAKVTRTAIDRFGSTYGDVACKAQVQSKVMMFVMKERVASLQKLALTYEKIADDFLKTHPIAKR